MRIIALYVVNSEINDTKHEVQVINLNPRKKYTQHFKNSSIDFCLTTDMARYNMLTIIRNKDR